jgi:hypothetical protein
MISMFLQDTSKLDQNNTLTTMSIIHSDASEVNRNHEKLEIMEQGQHVAKVTHTKSEQPQSQDPHYWVLSAHEGLSTLLDPPTPVTATKQCKQSKSPPIRDAEPSVIVVVNGADEQISQLTAPQTSKLTLSPPNLCVNKRKSQTDSNKSRHQPKQPKNAMDGQPSAASNPSLPTGKTAPLDANNLSTQNLTGQLTKNKAQFPPDPNNETHKPPNQNDAANQNARNEEEER